MTTRTEYISNLEEFLKHLKNGRAAMYMNGVPIIFTVTNLAHCDQMITAHEAIIAGLRKLELVEQEALQLDAAMKSQIGSDGKVGRSPDGRDYDELFAIISPPIKREDA